MILCPVCGAQVPEEGGKPYPGAGDNELGLSSIVFCEACGLGLAVPAPSEERLDAYYGSSAFWGGQKVISRRGDISMLEQARSRWRYVDCFADLPCERLRVLDVGAGIGCIGLEADDRLDHYVAVEPDAGMRNALAEAWAAFGKSATIETLESIDQAEGAFDLVVCSHVLEHVVDPCRFMATMRGHLARDGVCFIEVPYRDDLFKEDLFPHLLFYSPESMEAAILESGFTPLDIRVVGTPRSRSPLNPKAGRWVYRASALLRRLGKLLPLWLLRRLFSLHYQWDVAAKDGVWLRVLMKRR
ncbi:MAG: class I SAM-dependent methyltransferase [Pseudodesulfovibrio sp.]